MTDNDRIGIRIGPGSNNNTITRNTIARNGIYQLSAQDFPASGILIVSAK